MPPDGDILYHTYKSMEKDEKNMNYEERLIPKEIESDENKKNCNTEKKLFKGIEADDIIILLLILFLKNEKYEDNTLLIILASLILL